MWSTFQTGCLLNCFVTFRTISTEAMKLKYISLHFLRGSSRTLKTRPVWHILTILLYVHILKSWFPIQMFSLHQHIYGWGCLNLKDGRKKSELKRLKRQRSGKKVEKATERNLEGLNWKSAASATNTSTANCNLWKWTIFENLWKRTTSTMLKIFERRQSPKSVWQMQAAGAG